MPNPALGVDQQIQHRVEKIRSEAGGDNILLAETPLIELDRTRTTRNIIWAGTESHSGSHHEGIDAVLEDPTITSIRLVTNAEKMVLRETQRAFVYFSMHALTVDWIIVNRLLPDEIADPMYSG